MELVVEAEQYEAEEYKAPAGPREPVPEHQKAVAPRAVEEQARGRAEPEKSLGLWQHQGAQQRGTLTEAVHNRAVA